MARKIHPMSENNKPVISNFEERLRYIEENGITEAEFEKYMLHMSFSGNPIPHILIAYIKYLKRISS